MIDSVQGCFSHFMMYLCWCFFNLSTILCCTWLTNIFRLQGAFLIFIIYWFCDNLNQNLKTLMLPLWFSIGGIPAPGWKSQNGSFYSPPEERSGKKLSISEVVRTIFHVLNIAMKQWSRTTTAKICTLILWHVWVCLALLWNDKNSPLLWVHMVFRLPKHNCGCIPSMFI